MKKNSGVIFGKTGSPSKTSIKNLKLISREYNIGMCCIICNEEKERKTFIIEQKITDDVVYKKKIKINQNICPECFREDSVAGQHGDQIKVVLTPYKEIVEAKFWAKSEIKREDILFMSEVAEILKQRGSLRSKMVGGELSKNAREMIQRKNPSFIKKIKAPSLQGIHLVNRPYITKLDFESFLNCHQKLKGDNIKYAGKDKVNKLSEGRILDLFNLGYVIFGSDGKPKFGDNRTKKMKPCIKCGEIKGWSDFYEYKDLGSRSNECLDCTKKRYEENREARNSYMREYNKTPTAKAMRKKWAENNPEHKVIKNLRRRIREVVDGEITAETKDVGMNTKEVKRYLEKQFVIYGEWMNWDNKGAGENSDHQDCWHVDHLIPISKWKEKKHLLPTYFEGMGPNHYTNLRPLSGIENIARGNKVNPEEIEEHFKKIAEIFPDMGFSQQKRVV